jgi:hypothetical protein
MLRRLRLEYLEDRLTPATNVHAPIIAPTANHTNGSQTVVIHTPTSGGQSFSPMIGLPFGSSGSTGSGNDNGGGGGLGTGTGTPVGPGPGQ